MSSGLDEGGGGIYNWMSNPTVTNCTFGGNWGLYGGGGMFNNGSNSTLTNCTFSDNLAYKPGRAMYDVYSSTTVTSCILWGDSGWVLSTSDATVTYSNVKGGYPGIGNIDIDPCFVDPGHWEDPFNTPGDLTDDVWVEGDYHLLYNSPCINAGDPCFVPDPCDVDMDGELRVRLGRVDMGADEAGSNPADFDENGLVEFGDFSTLAAAYMSDPARPIGTPPVIFPCHLMTWLMRSISPCTATNGSGRLGGMGNSAEVQSLSLLGPCGASAETAQNVTAQLT